MDHCVWQILEKIKDIFERAAQKLANISGGVKNPGHLEEGGGAKMAKIPLWGKNIEKIREPKKCQNSIWGKNRTSFNMPKFQIMVSRG